MQDRFKFRAFDTFVEKMIKNPISMCDGEMYEHLPDGYNIKHDIGKSAIVMQCTGLKDKNGKLIYESDIVRDDKDLVYVVVFCEHEYTTSFSLKRIEIPNYYPHITTYCGLGYKNRNNFEIIGNIYENKELLNE